MFCLMLIAILFFMFISMLDEITNTHINIGVSNIIIIHSRYMSSSILSLTLNIPVCVFS